MRDLDLETTALQETGRTRLLDPTLSEVEELCDRLGIDGGQIRLNGYPGGRAIEVVVDEGNAAPRGEMGC